MSQQKRIMELLQQTRLSDDDFVELGQMGTLRKLAFKAGARLPRRAFQHLQGSKRLQFITIEESKIAPADVEDLAAIPGLKHLHFVNCPVTNAAVKSLGGHPTLTQLWLKGSKVTDAALKHVAAIPNLRWLELDDTAVTDNGLPHLSAAENLATLGLRNTVVTDEGVLALAPLRKLELDPGQVTGTDVTEQGIDALFAARKTAELKNRATKRSASPVAENSHDTSSARQVLASFFQAMNQWELESYRGSETGNRSDGTVDAQKWNTFCQERLDALQEIFEEHCTAKHRKYGRTAAFSCGNPPDYDLQTEEIVSVEIPTKSRIVVETKKTGVFRKRCQYVLLKERDKWLLDNKKWFYGDWQKDIL